MFELTKILIKDLTELLKNSDDYNINIIAGENRDIKSFRLTRLCFVHVHRIFDVHYQVAGQEKKVFIYRTGVVDLDLESGENILSLLVAADELEIHELIHHAQDNLMVKKSTWIQQNLVKIMHTIYLHESFKKIKRTCLKTISEEPHMIFKSEDSLSLEKSVLVSLLKRDDLAMDEIEIWNSIVKFGDISSDDYFEKDAKMENLGYYLKNSNQQFAKLQPLDQVSSNKCDVLQYKFKLLYRGSRDGFVATRYRQFYGAQYNIVVFVKINQTGKIIGGYNPKKWDENINHNRCNNASDAFIFTFDKWKRY
ncbi:10207_t:CDS:2 [Ambispora gerdemannii]|uniref:10207_t:CDS:1 n=1 Tax=Ambispora gerdemannii TaxID=144530 RepID=A0A9N9DBR9_9GLOM|nr:10207_t:CDS:2 [Ambispora gerdemannii]